MSLILDLVDQPVLWCIMVTAGLASGLVLSPSIIYYFFGKVFSLRIEKKALQNLLL